MRPKHRHVGAWMWQYARYADRAAGTDYQSDLVAPINNMAGSDPDPIVPDGKCRPGAVGFVACLDGEERIARRCLR